MKNYLILALTLLLLLGCGGEPAPTPDTVATEVAQAQAVAATLTAAVPTATSTPTPTLTATHTPTRPPTLTPTSTPTGTTAPTRTARPKPTSTRSPTATTKPTEPSTDPVMVAYLEDFAQIANKVWADFPGDSETPSEIYVDRLEPLYEQLEEMTVPKGATQMHDAFELATISVIQWHLYRQGALLFPAQFNDYMNAADAAGDEALAWYYHEYLPARDILLSAYGLSPEDVGFGDAEETTNETPPEATSVSVTSPEPTKVPATSTPAMQLLADSQADFTGGQGQNSWEFLFSEGRDSFNWKQMSFDGSCYRSPFTEEEMRICPDHGAPGAGGDIAWLYKAEASGTLVFKVTAKKAETPGDDIEIKVYRHTEDIKEWDLDEGDTAGFTKQFEVNANGGEMFFFTMQVQSIWREFQYDPNIFRVQVYLKE